MSEKTEHPSIKRFRERSAGAMSSLPVVLDAQELRETVLKAGADDVGFVEIDRVELATERDDILRFFPHTKSLVSFVVRMNREPIHNPARSVANLEFHHSGERVNEIARLDLKRKGFALSTRRWDFRWRWSTSGAADFGSFHIRL